jgi:hypothetical protein
MLTLVGNRRIVFNGQQSIYIDLFDPAPHLSPLDRAVRSITESHVLFY